MKPQVDRSPDTENGHFDHEPRDPSTFLISVRVNWSQNKASVTENEARTAAAALRRRTGDGRKDSSITIDVAAEEQNFLQPRRPVNEQGTELPR